MLYNLGIDTEENFIVAQEQFNQNFTGKAEAIMCQGNGYMGIRAATEENYIGNVRNTFISGTFNKFGDEVTELPNVADVIALPFIINGEALDLSKGTVDDYLQTLNLKNGLLSRDFTWTSNNGDTLQFCFKRMVSMANRHLIVQEASVSCLNSDVSISLASGINGQVSNSGSQHFVEGEKRCYDKKYLQSVMQTSQSNIDFVINSAHKFSIDGSDYEPQGMVTIERRKIFVKYGINLAKGQNLTLTKMSTIHTSRDDERSPKNVSELKVSGLAELKDALKLSFNAHLEASAKVWIQEVWDKKDIIVDTKNSFDQLALRFALYHLTVMSPVHDNRMNIGAKGLSGEGYKGHTFWDTEIFMLPHFILADPKAARSLIEYRYRCINGARRKAKENGCEGAMYPWESAWIDDGEVTPLYGAADVVTGEAIKIWTGIIEQHITSDVAYGAYYYFMVTGDQEFMDNCGYEIIMDTAKFWQSRLEYNKTLDRYEINGVIGPDEYKEHVNNNAYTNYMAHWNIKLAMEYANKLKSDSPEIYDRINMEIDIEQTYKKWEEKLGKIYLPAANCDLIVPQDDTFLSLPHINLDKYKQCPDVGTIYHDYNMDQINSMQVSKQADVLVLFYIMENLFEKDVKKANFYFYEERCLHDSSLSLSTHSILASDLHEKAQAYSLFSRACQIDLGTVMTSSDAGVHAASFGGIWQCAVNGFAGVRVVGGKLRITPNLPDAWDSMSTKIYWQGQALKLDITKEVLQITNLTNNGRVELSVGDKTYRFPDEISIQLS